MYIESDQIHRCALNRKIDNVKCVIFVGLVGHSAFL